MKKTLNEVVVIDGTAPGVDPDQSLELTVSVTDNDLQILDVAPGGPWTSPP